MDSNKKIKLNPPSPPSYFGTHADGKSVDSSSVRVLTHAELEEARVESKKIMANIRAAKFRWTAYEYAEEKKCDKIKNKKNCVRAPVKFTRVKSFPTFVPLTESYLSQAEKDKNNPILSNGAVWVSPLAPLLPPPRKTDSSDETESDSSDETDSDEPKCKDPGTCIIAGGTRRMRYNKKQNKQSKRRFRSRVSTSNLRRYSKSKRISRKRLHKCR